MKILVTGSEGFVGKNLRGELRNRGYEEVFCFDRQTDEKLLNIYTKECDFVYHLAGVNRPENDEEFMKGNYGFTSKVLNLLKKHDNKASVLITSSIQAKLDNPYGRSKKAGEEVIFEYGRENGAEVYVYRLPNLFGKWSKPNYNSVVATFCHNIAHDLEIEVHDPDVDLTLAYIDDVVDQFINALDNVVVKEDKYCKVPLTHSVKLGKLAELIKSFKENRENLCLPDMGDEFTKKLYSTYLSYLPEDNFSYDLKMQQDDRGSFTEMLRTENSGQVSINVSKPGIIKGNHWHHTKNEKFLVVSGQGIIRFRHIYSDEVIEYEVSENKLEVVDIPTGYTHNIENTGDTNMVTVMWANECYDPDNPDTYFLEV